jgi:predicted NBD/HSP70 family sugar kinase
MTVGSDQTTWDHRAKMLQGGRLHAGNARSIRESNNLLVLNCLRDHEPIASVAIARKLGMEPATVCRIIQRLARSGLVSEGELAEATHRSGRRAVLLHLDRSARYALGIDVASRNCSGLMVDLGGRVLQRASRTTERGVVETILALIEEMLARIPAEDRGKLLGIGIGAIDANYHAGTMRVQDEWVPIVQRVESRFNIETFVEENSNAFAMAEKHLGFGRKASSFLCKWYRYGVGHALVIDGKLFRGAHNSFGEMRDYFVAAKEDNAADDPLRATQVRPQAIVEVAKRMGEEAGPHLRAAIDSQTTEAVIEAVAEGVRCGDPATLAAVERIAWAMSVGFSVVADLVDPELIVVGGPVTQWGDYLLALLRKNVAKLVESPVRTDRVPRIEFTPLGADVIALGGASLVLDALFAGADRR